MVFDFIERLLVAFFGGELSNKGSGSHGSVGKSYDKSSRKGELGEYKIDLSLGRLSGDYRVFNDVFIRNHERFAQIDHVVVSSFGIFVIEVKNYMGVIIGDERSKYWYQNFGGNSKSFYSPIKQNFVHILALKRLLKGFSKIPYFSIVTFSRRCDLKVVSADVIWDTDIEHVILRKSKDRVLNSVDMERICQIIDSVNIRDVSVRQKHIEMIRNKNEQYRNSRYFCANCGKGVTENVANFCLENNGRFKGRIYCFDHQQKF
ncbi:nuclease-related domain-containing protein [Desulfosporosinus sp. PR]|uniref:nuclease-related domain-containing protein n=1 Tax=Candidatus Desulfosporosinus nitrosoreducens TaxID=3401928 RepID=UPI0027FCCAFD|nr:nuclease-related domain-containing protein [Desulfosporosinus sp. PR]MDQ7095009.1 nuclease-related domain-containing protein [Desulfosporosinus sp. PR]